MSFFESTRISEDGNNSRAKTIADLRSSPERPCVPTCPGANRTIPMSTKEEKWQKKYGDSFHASVPGTPPNYPSLGSSVPSDMAPYITDDSSHGFWNPFASDLLRSSTGGHVTFNVSPRIHATVNIEGPASFNTSGDVTFPSFNLPPGAVSTPKRSGDESVYKTAQSSFGSSFSSARESLPSRSGSQDASKATTKKIRTVTSKSEESGRKLINEKTQIITKKPSSSKMECSKEKDALLADILNMTDAKASEETRLMREKMQSFHSKRRQNVTA